MAEPTSTILRKGAITRQKIVEQALIQFADRGVEAATLKDIATGVGISEPAVYRHFISKADLVWQIFSDGYCGLAEEVERAAAAEPSYRGKIDSIIEAYCRLHDTNMPLFRFLFLTQHGQLSKMTEAMPSPVDVVLKVVEAGMDAGEIPAGNATLTTALLFGLVTQPAVFHIYGRLPGGMTSYMPALSQAAWAVMAGEGR